MQLLCTLNLTRLYWKMKYKQKSRFMAGELFIQHEHWQNSKTSHPSHHNSESNCRDKFFNQGHSARNTRSAKWGGSHCPFSEKLVQGVQTTHPIAQSFLKLEFRVKVDVVCCSSTCFIKMWSNTASFKWEKKSLRDWVCDWNYQT